MVINTSLLFSWLFHILHLLFFSCSLECPRVSQLLSISMGKCHQMLYWTLGGGACTPGCEGDAMFAAAAAWWRGRAPSLWACRERSAFKACTLPGSPWTRASRRHYCHTWSRHMRTFLHPLAGADLMPRQVVQVQAQLFVCHARGISANIIIELSQWYW